MSAAAALRIQELAAERNRELDLEAGITAALGVLFTLLIFGGLYWVTFIWAFPSISGGSIGFSPKAFGVTAIFFVVAAATAWRQIDPLQKLDPMSPGDELLTSVSLAVGGAMAFSPRHAVAGVSSFLIGGPANIFEAIGIVRSRIRTPGETVTEAMFLLEQCRGRCPLRTVQSPRAVLLLRRLELIKVLDDSRGRALTVTEKGRGLLGPAPAPAAI